MTMVQIIVMIFEIRLSGELYNEGLAVATRVLGVKAPISSNHMTIECIAVSDNFAGF